MASTANYTHEFASEATYKRVCGVRDHLIPIYENLLNVEIIPRGNALRVFGTFTAQDVTAFFRKLEDFAGNLNSGEELEAFDIRNLHAQIFGHGAGAVDINSRRPNNGDSDFMTQSVLNDSKNKIFVSSRGRTIYPKTENQAAFVELCRSKSIVFGVGPAGTGKTFLSVVLACAALDNGDVDKIVLSRPAVEAGENLGFLPGDMVSKVDPYLRPLYDGLYECYGVEKAQRMTQDGRVEVAPLAFMRGRNIANSFILLDEAQNCTMNQLKMFLTRLGKGSKMLICGDVTQIDLMRGQSGLQRVMDNLASIDEIGQVMYTEKDICRHPLVEKIVRALGDK